MAFIFEMQAKTSLKCKHCQMTFIFHAEVMLWLKAESSEGEEGTTFEAWKGLSSTSVFFFTIHENCTVVINPVREDTII